MTNPLDGRVVLVTGGAGGLGRQVALDAAAAGAAVAVHTMTDERAASAVVEEIEATGGRAMSVAGHVFDEDAVQAMVDAVRARLGAITIVVHCARSHDSAAIVQELAEDRWRHALSIALEGAFLLTRATLPDMVAARFGRLVLVSGTTARLGLPEGSAHHAASDAGLEGFVRAIAQEHGADGITANVVASGLRDGESSGRDAPSPTGWDPVAASTTKRLVSVEEVSSMCIHLCRPLAGAINGATVAVDGGRAAR